MKQDGISLIETLVAMAILGIVMGLAAVPFRGTSAKYKLLRSVREVHSRMNFARYKAVCEGTKVRLRFDADGYLVETWDKNQSVWKQAPKYFVDGAVIAANNTPTFYPVGTVSNLCTVHVSNTWGTFKLSLAISGRIKVTQVDPPPSGT